MIKSGIAKLLTLKAVLAAAGLAAGGVALAAGTGHMPVHLGQAQHAAHASASHGAQASRTHSPQGTPSPSLRGLCHAFGSVSTNPGKALDNPAFSALIKAAGGKANVGTFCTALLATSPSSSHSAHHGKPTSNPGHKPTAHPTHPAGKPSTHPSHPAPHPSA